MYPVQHMSQGVVGGASPLVTIFGKLSERLCFIEIDEEGALLLDRSFRARRRTCAKSSVNIQPGFQLMNRGSKFFLKSVNRVPRQILWDTVDSYLRTGISTHAVQSSLIESPSRFRSLPHRTSFGFPHDLPCYHRKRANHATPLQARCEYGK